MSNTFIATNPDVIVSQQGNEDVGREGNWPIQTSLELGVDHPAVLQKTPIRPLLSC